MQIEQQSAFEDYDVPRPRNPGNPFQNSIPHYAESLAVSAMIASGASILDEKVLGSANSIMERQINPSNMIEPGGHWLLQRAPTRQSIWSIWPNLASLTDIRNRMGGGTAQTIVVRPGLAIQSTSPAPVKRRELVGTPIRSAVGKHKALITIWAFAILIPLVALILFFTDHLTFELTLTAFVLPVLLLILQILIDKYRKQQ